VTLFFWRKKKKNLSIKEKAFFDRSINLIMVATTQQPKGSGGSALKRLKKSLQVAGVVGQTSKASRSKKDRKRGAPTEAGKNDADKKLSLIRGEFNPFEQKHQKTKFEILGRKMKGTSGKPTLSKQVGEENVSFSLYISTIYHIN
jgi:nucleolar protein 14